LDPRFAGPNAAEGDEFLMAIKILSTLRFGGEVKPYPHVVRFYYMLNPLEV
jgi:hypothetical protein